MIPRNLQHGLINFNMNEFEFDGATKTQLTFNASANLSKWPPLPQILKCTAHTISASERRRQILAFDA